MDIKFLKEAMLAANKKVVELGEKGIEEVQKNQHGDTALVGDIEAEKAIIDYFKKHNLPIRVVSEEHGTTDITENPKYLAILDGVDGSRVYKSDREKRRYGTMFCLYSNLDPVYDDYIFASVMEHKNRMLYFCEKDKGFFVRYNDGVEETAHVNSSKTLSRQTVIRTDSHWEYVRENFDEKLENYTIECMSTSCMHYVDLALGYVDLVTECTRKGNLEIGTGYALVKEAGGVVVDINKEIIGDKKFKVFGQDNYHGIICAASNQLIEGLFEVIKTSEF